MRYSLSPNVCLKWLETPSIYHINKDELYELDDESFEFLKLCSSEKVSDAENTAFIEYCLQEGLLTSQKISVNRPSLIKSPEPSLRYLELQITDRCNLRCKHCYIGSPPSPLPSPSRGEVSHNTFSSRVISISADKEDSFTGPPPLRGGSPQATRRGEDNGAGVICGLMDTRIGNHLSVEQIRNILIEFEEMQGLRVLITGGEPLLHSDFEKINQMLPEFQIRKVLFTNGLLLNRALLKKLHVDEIQISIDGLQKAHDILRGAGTFARSMNSIRLCLEMGFEVSVSTMIHADNLNDFDEMNMLFKNMGIRDWTVDIPCISGRLSENQESQVSPETGGRYLKYGFGEGLHGSSEGYGCGLHLMSVMADGKVTKCTFYADRAVGVIQDGLRECWSRVSPIRLSDLTCDCAYLASCRGGCRYRAEVLGNAKGKDLYRCALYDIIKAEK